MESILKHLVNSRIMTYKVSDGYIPYEKDIGKRVIVEITRLVGDNKKSAICSGIINALDDYSTATHRDYKEYYVFIESCNTSIPFLSKYLKDDEWTIDSWSIIPEIWNDNPKKG